MDPVTFGASQTERSTARSASSARAFEEELEKSAEFRKILEKFDAMQETAEEKRARRAKEAEAAQEKSEKNKKIAQLRGRIAQLKSKLMSTGDPSVKAEIAALETQLFWLMFSM
ncbi:MAG TPA: hypothetical protein DEB31_10565 [Clostridiales bacterium]|nr:hypothetical protein [Clostridiales bacterium]